MKVWSPALAAKFNSSAEVEQFFTAQTKTNYIDWFNAQVAHRGNWAGRAIANASEVRERLRGMWDAASLIVPEMPFNLLQFCALTSTVIWESGAHLAPAAELCGRSGFPGLAYAFCEIPGVKRSYNVSSLNKPAGDLFFANEDFWGAHQDKGGAAQVRSAPALRAIWNSAIYPQNQFACGLDAQQTGFIQEADFFKFRGRGWIQVTWRANYKKLVQFVQSYEGANPVVNSYKARWSGKDLDTVCTLSANADWDALFLEPQFTTACRAIGLHSQSSGNYLNLSSDPAKLTALAPLPGSLYYMGWRINGRREYASQFAQRVTQMLTTLNYTG